MEEKQKKKVKKKNIKKKNEYYFLVQGRPRSLRAATGHIIMMNDWY